jgi:SAM-dependent methyltransferase
VRALGRAVSSAIARFPWSWRLFSGPVRRFFDSVAVGWDERVRSDSPEYLEPLVAVLDRLEASPGRIVNIGTGTGAAPELADRYPDAEVVGIDISAQMVKEAKESKRSLPAAAGRDVQGSPQKVEHRGLMIELALPDEVLTSHTDAIYDGLYAFLGREVL